MQENGACKFPADKRAAVLTKVRALQQKEETCLPFLCQAKTAPEVRALPWPVHWRGTKRAEFRALQGGVKVQEDDEDDTDSARQTGRAVRQCNDHNSCATPRVQ